MENEEMNWKTRFKEDFSPYSTNEVIRKAIEEKNRNIPERLFRFRSFNDKHPEYTEDEMSGKLCFQPRKNLNDPYDGTIMQNRKDPLDYLRNHGFLKKEILDDVFKYGYDNDTSKRLVNHILSANNSNLAKVKGVSEEDYQKHLKTTLDITEQFIKSANNHFKCKLDMYSQIVCFSEDLYNQLMWAHYANAHYGYCFEYNFHKLNLDDYLSSRVLDWLLPVCYIDALYDYIDVRLSLADKYHDIELIPLSGDYFFRTFLINKLKDWSYEKEWRLIMGVGELTALKQIQTDFNKYPVFEQHRKFMSEPHTIPILKPTAVYLGERLEQQPKELILSLANKYSVTVYQMEASLTGLTYSLIKDCTN